MEGDITHGPENAVHRRSSSRHACRSPSCARSTASPARPGTSGSTVTCAHGPAGLEERSRAARAARRMQTPEEIVTALLDARRRHPTLGRQEAAGAAAQAPSALGAAWPLDGVRHPQPPRPGAAGSAAARHWPSRQADELRSWRPTTSGARTTKASSGRAMAATAIR